MEGNNRNYSESDESARELEELIQCQEQVRREVYILQTSPPIPLGVKLREVGRWLFRGY